MNAVALQKEYPAARPVRLQGASGRLVFPRQSLWLHSRRDSNRTAVEAYITDHFHTAYGAKVSSFLPLLISARFAGKTSAAVGLQTAKSGSLFLEQYLSAPLEQMLGLVTGQKISRNTIIEIGNLTVTHAGNSYLLFILLTAILNRAGFEWVSFTATRQVRRILGKLECRAYKLGRADRLKLNPGSGKWGSYYETKPEVLAVNIHESMQILKQQQFTTNLLDFYQETIIGLAEQLKETL